MATKNESIGEQDLILSQKNAEIEVLKTSLAKARSDIDQMKKEIALNGVPEHLAEMVRQKEALGLPREDAIEVARRQFERAQNTAAAKP